MIGVMRRTKLGAGLALMVAAGCYTWHPHALTAAKPSSGTHTVRVTTNHGARRLTLQGATVRSDSVLGFLLDAEDRRGDRWVRDATIPMRRPAAVAAADVESVEGRATNWMATAAVILGVLAVVLVVSASLALSGSNYQAGLATQAASFRRLDEPLRLTTQLAPPAIDCDAPCAFSGSITRSSRRGSSASSRRLA